MEIDIYNYKEFRNRGYIINHKDTIIFHFKEEEYHYYVQSAWLSHCTDGPENIILQRLQQYGLIDNIKDFCNYCYGYKVEKSLNERWPECKNGDMLALTNIVYTIFDLIGDESPISKIELTPLIKLPFQYGNNA